MGEAYKILSDDEKRSRYDQYGFAGVDPNYGAGAGGGAGFGGSGGQVGSGSGLGFGGGGGLRWSF